MMNKHIEFVKEWLADNDCKTQQELEGNYTDAAYADAADAAAYAAYAANAAYFAVIGAVELAANYIERYERLTK
jgi:hypothetical protein